MSRICIYPGSFDPVTVGHLDIIRRAAELFDEVIVVILHNPHKKGCFSIEERLAFLQRCCSGIDHVRVESAEGLTVAYARSVGACAMIRGLRSAADFEAEKQLAQVNMAIAPEIETLFLTCRPEHAVVSSTNVREMASFGCDLTGFVPAEIMEDVLAKF